MSSTILLPPRAQLCVRYYSNKQQRSLSVCSAHSHNNNNAVAQSAASTINNNTSLSLQRPQSPEDQNSTSNFGALGSDRSSEQGFVKRVRGSESQSSIEDLDSLEVMPSAAHHCSVLLAATGQVSATLRTWELANEAGKTSASRAWQNASSDLQSFFFLFPM